MKKRVAQIVVSTVLGIMLIFSQVAPGQASELGEKKDELSKVNSQIEERREQLNKNEQQQKDVLVELNEVDQDIAETDKELQRIGGELSALQNSIDEIEPQLQKKEEALQERTDAYHKRLRDIYMQGNLSYLEVLLDSTSMSDFLMRFDLLKKITDQDTKMVKELTEERDTIARQKRELEAKKVEAAVLRETTTAKQKDLVSLKQDREATIANLESDRAACKEAIQQLEASSQQITQLIQQHQSKNQPSNSSYSPPSRGTGRYIWPASGPITSPYGMRYHPVTGVYKLHTGIDIGAPYGASIVAADAGTVITAGWMNGYGNTVIIDHGGGYSTLYAHMSSISVGGGGVGKGQVIGYVGSTGWSTGPHLHFEVRINGNPTNPLGYL
ncbi:MAG: peptidoglycan DD-metalloendopeptidase family protein [Syntrophaceticus sp.]|nr:peptidoglycan DD-metalloendopeptidase family protein [Syntrophaceticus sp.]MDD4360032.1 peptidoglycan DD-metalloendopeptidase family protein [Syntrophaceticus sp.]HBG23077.1 peptidase M23 [Peptococcaceae bacterium]